MNIVLLEAEEARTGRVLLTDRRAAHLVKILKVSPGQVVRVGVIGGGQGEGRVVTCGRGYPFQVELAVRLAEVEAIVPPIDLLLALPRPIMLKRILCQAAALGVGSIAVVQAARVEKSFWDATLLAPEEVRFQLVQGLEQAVDTRLPVVTFHKGFKPFVEDCLPGRLAGYAHLLLAHPGSGLGLSQVMGRSEGRVLVAIGPEGGWVDYEVGRLEEAGFRAFSLGPRILKVDTAVVALHGRIALLLEQIAGSGA